MKQGLQIRKYRSWLNVERNIIVPFIHKHLLPTIIQQRQVEEYREDGENMTANSRQLVVRNKECDKRSRAKRDFSKGKEGEPTIVQTQAVGFELTFRR